MLLFPPSAGLLLRLSLCLVGARATAAAGASPAAPVERRLSAMGTTLAVRVGGLERSAALSASEAAVREIERAERLLTTWKPGGPIDRLNRAPSGDRVALGFEAADVLAGVFAWRDRTEGAFDPTVLPLVRIWDLRGQGRVPTPAELAQAREAIGTEWFELDCGGGTAARRRTDAGIDEGAWGKGYALDRAGAALRHAGVTEATLDLGGQVLVLGRAAIGISHPRERGRIAASIDVTDASVSTSGNSERGLIVGGRPVGHLLDPRTGEPAPDFGSATAIAPSGLAADVLSTALFVLGPEKGLQLSERLRAGGFDNQALFLVVARGRIRILCSPGLKKHLFEGGTF